MAETCRITRHPAVAMAEITGTAGVWPTELNAVVADMATTGFVLALSPERRIVRLGDTDVRRWRQPVAHAGGRLIDVTHGWRVFVLEGSRAHDLLARGIELDLQPRHFLAGTAVATLCARVPIILYAAGEARFELFVATSYADWLFSWLDAVRAPLRATSGEGVA